MYYVLVKIKRPETGSKLLELLHFFEEGRPQQKIYELMRNEKKNYRNYSAVQNHNQIRTIIKICMKIKYLNPIGKLLKSYSSAYIPIFSLASARVIRKMLVIVGRLRDFLNTERYKSSRNKVQRYFFLHILFEQSNQKRVFTI